MSDEVSQRVIKVIAATQHIPLEKIAIDSKFEELGIDSLDGINILFGLESEFNVDIPDEEAKKIRSIRDAVEGVEKLLAASSSPQ
jgi:acyl carrier protein